VKDDASESVTKEFVATMPLDTTKEAEAVQIELLRRATHAQRAALALSLSNTVIALARRAIAEAHPELNADEQGIFFVDVHYGRRLADCLRQHLQEESRDS